MSLLLDHYSEAVRRKHGARFCSQAVLSIECCEWSRYESRNRAGCYPRLQDLNAGTCGNLGVITRYLFIKVALHRVGYLGNWTYVFFIYHQILAGGAV